MTSRRDELDEILKELRAEHLEITAPEGLEARLRAAARAARPVEAPRASVISWSNWSWGFAAAAAVLILGLVMWGVGRGTHAPVQQAVVETNSNPAQKEPTQEVATAETRPAEGDLSPELVRTAERRRQR